MDVRSAHSNVNIVPTSILSRTWKKYIRTSRTACQRPLPVYCRSDEDLAVLEKAFQKEEGKEFVWLQNMGNIVLPVSAAEVGIFVNKNDSERHSILRRKAAGSPAYVYRFKHGRAPKAPKSRVCQSDSKVAKWHSVQSCIWSRTSNIFI